VSLAHAREGLPDAVSSRQGINPKDERHKEATPPLLSCWERSMPGLPNAEVGAALTSTMFHLPLVKLN
jgi:hypothetical protein